MKVLCHIKKDYLRDYLHYLFAYEEGAFSVFRTHTFGKYLCSRVRYSDTPHPTPRTSHPETRTPHPEHVTFRMPRSSVYKGMQYRFMYYTAEDQQRIEDHLEALFYIDFDRYYLESQKLGLQQKIAIHNFIVSRKLISKIGDIEMIKKRQYRNDQKIINKLSQNLRRRAYIQSKVVAKTIKEYENTLNKTLMPLVP